MPDDKNTKDHKDNSNMNGNTNAGVHAGRGQNKGKWAWLKEDIRDAIVTVALFLSVALFTGSAIGFVLDRMSDAEKEKVERHMDYAYAYITLPNGQLVEGNVRSFAHSFDENLVITVDNVTYLVDSSNVVLMAKAPDDLEDVDELEHLEGLE